MVYYNYIYWPAMDAKEYLDLMSNGYACVTYTKKVLAAILKELPTRIDQNDDDAVYAMSRVWYSDGTSDQKARAVNHFKRLAAKGHVPSINAYGVYFEQQKNYGEAFRWFHKAAREGFAISEHNLALMYLKGMGVPVDEHKGLELLERASMSGYAKSNVVLCDVYLKGKYGQSKDVSRAFSYAQLASEAMYPVGMYQIAFFYLDGDAVPQDIEKGVFQLNCAAAREHMGSILTLADFYLNGDYVAKDAEKAYSYYTLAAELGNAEGMYYAGWLIDSGKAWWEDKKKGRDWIKRAAALGYQDAIDYLK